MPQHLFEDILQYSNRKRNRDNWLIHFIYYALFTHKLQNSN